MNTKQYKENKKQIIYCGLLECNSRTIFMSSTDQYNFSEITFIQIAITVSKQIMLFWQIV